MVRSWIEFGMRYAFIHRHIKGISFYVSYAEKDVSEIVAYYNSNFQIQHFIIFMFV